MSPSIRETTNTDRQSVVLERAFAAPRELLFKLFTEPEHLTQWWCPYPLTFPVCEFDARPEAPLNLVMQASDGTRFPRLGTMLEVDPPTKLVFSEQQDMDESGVPRTEVLQTVTFMERGSETLVRVQIDVVQGGATTAQTLRGMDVGWMQDFGRLEFYLLSWPGADKNQQSDLGTTPVVTTPSDREIVVTRNFNAPREQVFSILTDPEMIPQWWGPGNSTTTVETMDLRPGGKWRYLLHRPDTDTLEFSGEYFLIDSPELLVNSFEIGPRASATPFDQLEIDAVHLLARERTTRMTSISLFPSKAERDRALDAGMVNGAIEMYERLDRVLLASV